MYLNLARWAHNTVSYVKTTGLLVPISSSDCTVIYISCHLRELFVPKHNATHNIAGLSDDYPVGSELLHMSLFEDQNSYTK